MYALGLGVRPYNQVVDLVFDKILRAHDDLPSYQEIDCSVYHIKGLFAQRVIFCFIFYTRPT
jgi:hypothetical protein